MTVLDKLQQAWQSQSCPKLEIHSEQLLTIARLEWMVALLSDIVVILILGIVGAGMLSWALRDIHQEWPWLIYTASDVWVISFILFNQWRRRRHVAHYDEPLLAHVEWSIKDIEHRMRQDRYTLWWYTLPIALGCMIPPTISFAIDYIHTPRWSLLLVLFSTLGFFIAIFIVIHWVIRTGLRIKKKSRLEELEALRTLRETLLNAEESHI